MRALIEEISGQKYSIRPGFCSVCPYCFRVQKTTKDRRALGFSQVAFRRHVFACFEKALKDAGFVECGYDSTIDRFKVKSISDETAPTNP